MLNKRRLKLAKAIYRKYIISGGIVAKKINPATKSSIYERVRHSQLDLALFQRAKQEVQEAMEVEVYPVFLKSHNFLTYTQGICAEEKNHQQELNSHKQELINGEQKTNRHQEVNSYTPETGNDKQEVTNPIQEPESGKKDVKQKMENSKQDVSSFSSKLVQKREWVECGIALANHRRPEQWDAG